MYISYFGYLSSGHSVYDKQAREAVLLKIVEKMGQER
jgi:hypothetical protein